MCLPLWLVDLVLWLVVGLFFRSVIFGIFLKATVHGVMRSHPTLFSFPRKFLVLGEKVERRDLHEKERRERRRKITKFVYFFIKKSCFFRQASLIWRNVTNSDFFFVVFFWGHLFWGRFATSILPHSGNFFCADYILQQQPWKTWTLLVLVLAETRWLCFRYLAAPTFSFQAHTLPLCRRQFSPPSPDPLLMGGS